MQLNLVAFFIFFLYNSPQKKGAMAKGWKTAPYPAPWILKHIAAKGGSIIINSDCHKAEALDFAFDEALALAHSTGVNILTCPPRLKFR